MNKQLQALIFDCDGVLVDTERDGHRAAFNQCFARKGLNIEWDVNLYGDLLEVAGGKERMRHYFNANQWPDNVTDRDNFIKDLEERLAFEKELKDKAAREDKEREQALLEQIQASLDAELAAEEAKIDAAIEVDNKKKELAEAELQREREKIREEVDAYIGIDEIGNWFLCRVFEKVIYRYPIFAREMGTKEIPIRRISTHFKMEA